MLLTDNNSSANISNMIIENYLKKTNMTQQDFADLVGVTQGMVGHWINLRNKVTPDHAIIIEHKTSGAITKESLVFGNDA